MIETVGIVGLGAVGLVYALQLQKALGIENVRIFADEDRIARYKKDGIYVNHEKKEFCFVSENNEEPVDLLIFSVKFYDLSHAIPLVKKAIGEHTIVLSFLNGVTSEDLIADVLEPPCILYSTVQGMDATKEGNQMFYTAKGSVTFGDKTGKYNDQLLLVKELFDLANIKYQIADDILKKQWSKWMFNVGLNQACAVYETDYAGVKKEGEARTAMLCAMEEARQIACAHGFEITEQEKEEWVRLIETFADEGEPSMRQDTKAGRKTEAGLFSAVVCELGKEYGIKTPVNDEFMRILLTEK